jgi:hypothetical protein
MILGSLGRTLLFQNAHSMHIFLADEIPPTSARALERDMGMILGCMECEWLDWDGMGVNWVDGWREALFYPSCIKYFERLEW